MRQRDTAHRWHAPRPKEPAQRLLAAFQHLRRVCPAQRQRVLRNEHADVALHSSVRIVIVIVSVVVVVGISSIVTNDVGGGPFFNPDVVHLADNAVGLFLCQRRLVPLAVPGICLEPANGFGALLARAAPASHGVARGAKPPRRRGNAAHHGRPGFPNTPHGQLRQRW